MLREFAPQLEQHSEALLNYRKFIELNMVGFLEHEDRLVSVEKAPKKNKGVSNGVLWTLAGATVATAGTGIYFQRSSSKTMADMADRIHTQQGEINRMKALNGQQGGVTQGLV